MNDEVLNRYLDECERQTESQGQGMRKALDTPITTGPVSSDPRMGFRGPDPPLPYYTGGPGWSQNIHWREPPLPRPHFGGGGVRSHRDPILVPPVRAPK